MRPQKLVLRQPPAVAPATLWLLPNAVRALAFANRWLQPCDRTDARRHRHPERRRAFLIGRGLLRWAVSQHSGRPASRVQLRLASNRRPLHRTAGWTRQLALSISHSRDWVCVGVAPGASLGRRLGVDIEDSTRRVTMAVAARLPWQGQPGSLIQRWTLAEAALKADGRGLSALSRLHGNSHGKTQTDLFCLRSAPVSGLPGWPRPLAACALGRPRFQDPSR